MTQTAQESSVSLQQAIGLAQHAFEQGQWEQCKDLCARILQQQPSHGMARHVTGLARFRLGQTNEAVEALEKAISLEPDNPMFLANSVEVFRTAKDFDRAVALGERSVALDSGNTLARANLALAYYDKGDLERAKALHQEVLAQDPGYIASLNNLGSIARDEKEFETSKDYFGKVLALKPDQTESRNNLITVLIENNELDEALRLTAVQVARTPQMAEVHRNLGRILTMQYDLDGAESAFRHAITLDPELALSYSGLAQVMTEKNRPELALTAAKEGVAKDRTEATLHQAAACHAALGNTEDARGLYEDVLTLDPGFAAALAGLGHLETELGNFDAAKARFEAAQAADPLEIAGLVGISRLGKIRSEDDPVFQALTARLPEIEAMPTDKQISLHFAYGDCLDGLKRYDEAFAHYDKGAKLKRGTLSYTPDETEAQVQEIIRAFTADTLAQLRQFANPTARPIFVLGMPRSGTTLTEAIIAAHPQVHGAGELNDLLNLFHASGPQPQLKFPRCLSHLPPHEMQKRLAAYDGKLASLSDAARVVDKMPANFLLVGLIHALLPNAKIVHLRRNALDTCLSNLTRLFERAQPHSYDQVELGRFYNGYARLMDHWRALLPDGAFYDLDYEALVSDPEPQTRALLVHLGLAWDDACLNHQSGAKRVRTASVTQVRQPIYKASVRKSDAYRAHLASLIEVIEKG